jgi:hypothetical protein
MNSSESEIIQFIDELIDRGERLAKIEHRAYDNPPDSSIVMIGGYPVYPASEDEYSQWDTDCRILLTMLGNAGKAFEDEFAGSTYENAKLYVSLAPKKLGNLRAIKEGLLRNRIKVTVEQQPRETAERGRITRSAHIVNVHNLYGGVQLDSPGANQHVRISFCQEVHAEVERLREAVRGSDLDEFDKGEIEHNLDRIKRVAEGEQSQKSRSSILEKLSVVEKMVTVSERLAKIVAPLILALRSHFG